MSAPLVFEHRANPAPLPAEERARVLAAPGFGRHFTDHMVRATWTAEDGWHDARVEAYGPLQLDPSAAVLHYAQEVFEGLKAYRWEDGSVWSFRPRANAARLARSARRLALPELSEADFLASLHALVEADAAWVPSGGETSLYLRPFMFASEAFLGVRAAARVDYLVIASPAGSYFTGGLKPVSIWLSRDHARAAPGGLGAAKTGGNYAASLLPQQQAAEHGCEQVCFLDAAERTWVEELGGMNVYFVHADGTLVTPALTGTILEGVTRDAILQLAGEVGLRPVERRVSVQEWKDGAASGEITEVFACGTAAVVTPIGRLVDGEEEVVPRGGAEAGEVTERIRAALLDVQHGRAQDRHGWMHRLL
ncbi:branched-chain amino acid aminotransferase [Quadrisphaera sp. DSM 44207]|uniref:branched-chain amino acid aminotransferase n=1 Tax=Quadrisphaera sp. DSM 44207 TaxID=1881057 RepID=UPI0008906C1D|nr:branched-chain amino acid aminotransferase [Quadrisphaera sp. DSM 44207]SDQ74896.1 branched chain amino acid aminotransferase apoenzyme [Quadrisphaera sp. DSM 44207]